MRQVTFFKDIYDKENPKYVPVEKILKGIKDGAVDKQIHLLRQSNSDSERDRIKRGLYSICFSGKFKEGRKDAGLIKHSGLAVLDFDHVGASFKDVITEDPYTYCAFISPSGDGVKVIFKIPSEEDNHEVYYLGIIDYCENKGYPKLDTTSKNVSRVCFMSYDPDIYINEDSETFVQKKELPEVGEVRFVTAEATDYKKLDIACDMIRSSQDGEKHHQLIRASRLVGGFIAGGYVEEHEGVRILEKEINSKDISDFKGAAKAIRDGIEYGKKDPIFEDNLKEKVKLRKTEDVIIKDEPPKDVITVKDVSDKIDYSYKHGTSRGESTYFSEIDEIYRMKRGEVTLLHGIGNHGKSVVLRQILISKSKHDGYKWAIFSPEDMPVEEFYKDLIHTYIGKSTEPHHSNQMTEKELQEGKKFVGEHFFLIYPKDAAPTPKYMNNRFRELVIKENVDGCIIDPYNQLDNDLTKMGGREDQYISHFLTEGKRFAVEQNVFYYIVAHPKGGLRKKGMDGVDYECPNVYDLAGGAMWNNKLDNILVHHRPKYYSDRNDTTAIFASQKIKKQKLNGIPGEVDLIFDRRENRFRQISDGYSPLGDKQEDSEFIDEFKDKIPF